MNYTCKKLKMNFSKTLVNWYETHKRDLPWRHTNNPYKIWLSEIMLQQTQVKQGLPYYEKFISNFPKVEDLAKADEDEVMKLWQGLGYYSRARNLHFTAKYISNQLNGKFPDNYKDLLKLKGVGQYTAAAIASFAYNEAVPVVDGNVYRLLARLYGISTPINSSEGEKTFKKIAEDLLSDENPGIHNQAMMEFGAIQCKPKTPKCMFCTFQNECVAFQTNQIDALPVKLKKIKIKHRYLNFLIFEDQKQQTLVEKRTSKGIWQNLYQFPLVESEKKINSLSEQRVNDLFSSEISKIISIEKINQKSIKHQLTHQKLHADFWKINFKSDLKSFPTTSKTEISELKKINKYAVPVLIQNFIESDFFKA